MASQQRTGSIGGRSKGSWGGRRRRRRAFPALLAALAMVVAPFVSPGPASAGVGPSVTPSFPDTTTVGDQFVGSLFVANNSSPPNTVNPITVTSLTLAPGCSVNNAPNCAGGVDAGVFTLGPVGTGAGACAGILFGIVQTSPGLYTFTPSAPVVLPLAAQCRIDFNVTTTRVPSVDVAPGLPGVQTFVSATVQVTSQDLPPGTFANATGVQLVTVLPAPATIETTAAPQRVDVNEGFSDLATVTGVPGGPTPTGTVTFQLFGPTSPGFPTCTGTPAFTSAPIPLTATSPTTATAGSGTVTTANPGNYVFVATYNPAPGSSFTAVTSPCDDADERVTVEPLPTILVDKTATPLTMVEPGGTFTFNVVVTNTSNEPLTLTALTDDVYGNLNGRGTCVTGAPLAPNGGTYSCSFPGQFTGLAPAAQTDIVTATGTDADGNTATDTDDAIVRLTPSLPVIVVDKTATPASRPEPGGLFTFNVVVTNNSVRPVTITTLDDDVYGPLNGRGTCAIGASLAASGGTYSCSFTGPFNGGGGDRQVDVVTATAVDIFGNPATDSDDAEVFLTDVAPTVLVDKTATPGSRPEPGGDFTFNVVVTNTSNEPVTITSLTDDIYGNLATRPGTNSCTTSVGTVLASSPGPGNTYTCSFVGSFTGGGGAAQTDIVTAVVTDDEGTTATDDDDATVTLTDVSPTVLVDKTATPSSLPEPGGTFTFNVVVTNTSSEPVTITTLTDDVYGPLGTRGTCTTAIGTLLPANGGSYSCSFPGNFTGGAGDAQTDIVTSTVVDDEGTTATDSDDAVVTITDVAPVIRVDKTATPLTRLEPGGDFTFNVVVTNLSPESVTITTLTDDIYGNLVTRPGANTCTTSVGTVLASSPGPGNTYTCSFVAPFFGPAGAQQTDVVTATAIDDDGTTATDDDDAIVAITNVVPTIIVDKTATPDSRPEPGGTFTFNVTVTNVSIEPVTITSLTDDIYGNIATQGTCTTAVGRVLAASPGPGNTYSCSFTGSFNGNAGQSQTDIVTVVGIDDDASSVTDTDDATVTLTNVAPTVIVDKVAVPTSMAEPGGDFTFNVVVTNTSAESVTITSLTDDVYGDLANQGTCTTAIGTALAANGTYSCSFPGNFTGNAGTTQTDIVTADAVDDDGTTGTDTDNATVSITAVRKCQGEPVTIFGTAGDDVIDGTRGSDVIRGLGGNDTIRGGRGNDTICGGDGDDELIGNRGDDDLGGGDGPDLCRGGTGVDTVPGCGETRSIP